MSKRFHGWVMIADLYYVLRVGTAVLMGGVSQFLVSRIMLSPKIIIEKRHNVTMAIKSIYPVNTCRAKAPNTIITITYPTSGDKRIALKNFL